ncbi:uncharacterized protein [Halyomorpha halys]|uniref:uncharacterized protein n=1 Tax=Halyomorpha halys TaxID=286706 RepID=UPI0006D4FD51|nr:uncharacterized protein LOC106691256 [Halyomorpha halys]
MKFLAVLISAVALASAQTGNGGVPNLNTMQGIQQFLAYEQINPSSIVTSNCIMNGNPCSPNGGQPCCLSPVFSCQSNPLANGAEQCLVVPGHVQHIPQIKQIMNTFGVSTPNPVL